MSRPPKLIYSGSLKELLHRRVSNQNGYTGIISSIKPEYPIIVTWNNPSMEDTSYTSDGYRYAAEIGTEYIEFIDECTKTKIAPEENKVLAQAKTLKLIRQVFDCSMDDALFLYQEYHS